MNEGGINQPSFRLLRSLRSAFLNGSPLLRRLIFGVGANALGKAWVSVVQLLSLAILPRIWGAEGFGHWLMISTIPTYMAFSSLGFGDAAATHMTRRLGMGDRASALQALHTVWAFVTTLTVFVALVVIAAVFGAWRLMVFEESIAFSTIVLVIFALFVVQTSLLQAGYRATGRYAHGTFALGLMGLFEGLAVVGVAVLGGGILYAAIAMLLLRVLGFMASLFFLQSREPWLTLGYRHYSPAQLSELRRPALAAVGLTAGDALALQGMIVTLGLAVSPTAAATFGAVRTLCRMPLQASDVFGRASTPELTVASASGNQRLFDHLTLVNVGTAVLIAFPLLLVCAVFGPLIASHMTGKALVFSPEIFAVMAIVVCFQALRIAVSHSLIAVNEQHRYTHPYLFAAAAMAASPFLLSDSSAVLGAASVNAILELIILLFAIRGVFAVRAMHASSALEDTRKNISREIASGGDQ